MSSDLMTLGAVARKLGVQTWRVQRLFEEGVLTETQRAGNWRLVAPSELPAIRAALRSRGWLPSQRAEKEAVSA